MIDKPPRILIGYVSLTYDNGKTEEARLFGSSDPYQRPMWAKLGNEDDEPTLCQFNSRIWGKGLELKISDINHAAISTHETEVKPLPVTADELELIFVAVSNHKDMYHGADLEALIARVEAMQDEWSEPDGDSD